MAKKTGKKTHTKKTQAKKLTPQQVETMRGFGRRRDQMVQRIGVAKINYDNEVAYCKQQIELTQHEQQRFISEIAREFGMDVNRDYTLDYNTGELKYR